MCIVIPLQVTRVDGLRVVCVDDEGGESCIDASLIGEVRPGDWLMTTRGLALQIAEESQALSVRRALTALAAALRGDNSGLDAAFADLIDREPQLAGVPGACAR